jgi:hypothetical protein
MQKALLKRLRELEARMRNLTEPRKPPFPDWLVKMWAEDDARRETSGELDLESMKDDSRKGIDPSSEADPGPPGEV